MSYDHYETSTDDGAPVLLFHFIKAGKTDVYATNATQPITSGGQTYLPFPIRISNVRSTKDVQTSELTLTFPRDHPFLEDLRSPYQKRLMRLVMRRAHRPDPEDSIIYWRGRIIGVTSKGSGCEVQCENLQTTMKRLGNTAKYQKLCRHVLYGDQCGVSYDAKKVAGTIGAVETTSSFNVAVAGDQITGYYKGGILEHNGNHYFIVRHINRTLTILHPVEDMQQGDPVFIAPGCDLTIATCHARFANEKNHGGFPFTPTKTPYGGNSIYRIG